MAAGIDRSFKQKFKNWIAGDSESCEWDKISHYLNQNKYIKNKEARKVLYIQDTSKVSRLLSRWTLQELLVKIIPKTGAKRNVLYRLPTGDEKNLFAPEKSK